MQNFGLDLGARHNYRSTPSHPASWYQKAPFYPAGVALPEFPAGRTNPRVFRCVGVGYPGLFAQLSCLPIELRCHTPRHTLI